MPLFFLFSKNKTIILLHHYYLYIENTHSVGDNMSLVENFLNKIEVIKNLRPRYASGGSGTNGTCDCIGLIIGALRRAGIKYSGIHGSNWFARKEIKGLSKVNSVDDLKVGDAIFQTYEPGEAGYDLPGRYRKGGQYYNGDVRDYMHIGVVTSIEPLQITHMWQPTVTVDTSLKWWTYKGWIKKLGNEPSSVEPRTPVCGSKAKVVATSGATVNMRASPSLNARILGRIKLGTIVDIINPGENWAQIEWNGKKGYMMAKFLEII